MADEELFEPPPPSADKVARRAIILSVVSCRGLVDRDGGDGACELAARAYNWMCALNLDEDLSRWERLVLTSSFGSLTDRDRINASWLSEAVVVLAWSLGKLDLPGFDEQCDPAAVANSLGFLQPREATVINRPQLRPTEELREYNEFVYNLHWRLRDFSLNNASYNFEALARKAWGEPILRHGLTLCDGDVCVAGLPISKADEGARRTLESITQERHRASNWLIGYASEDFYEVTTDT